MTRCNPSNSLAEGIHGRAIVDACREPACDAAGETDPDTGVSSDCGSCVPAGAVGTFDRVITGGNGAGLVWRDRLEKIQRQFMVNDFRKHYAATVKFSCNSPATTIFSAGTCAWAA